MDYIGTYQEHKFSTFRNPTVDTLELGRKKHHVPVLFEIDVCDFSRKYRQRWRHRLGNFYWNPFLTRRRRAFGVSSGADRNPPR